jgi:hypothetical protein
MIPNILKCALAGAISSAAFAGPPPVVSVPPPASEWEFLVSIPGWAPGVSGDVGLHGFRPVSADVKFKEIFENLDMTAALTMEARHDRWGFILDGLYLKMSASGETPGRLLTSVDVEVEQILAEADLTYRLWEGRRGYLDLLVGARYIYLQSGLNFHLDSAGVQGISNDLSNAIVDRAVDAVQAEVAKAAEKVQERIEALDVNERAAALRSELRTRAVERVLQEHSVRDIVKAIAGLTPAERAQIAQQVTQSREIIAANKALAKAVIEERVSAAVAAARRRAQQAVNRARKQLASAINSAIRQAVPEHVEGSKSWVDPLVGFRARLNVTEKLYMVARGDIGGFGLGSDLAVNALGAVGYQWTRRLSSELGWRYLSIDYSDGGFIYDTRTSGVFLGLTYKL